MSIKTNKNFSLKKFSNIALFERREKNNMKIKSSKKIIPLKLYKNKIKVNEENKINSDFSHILFSFYSYQTEGNSTYKSFSKKSTNITTKSIFNKTTNNFNDTSFPFYITETEPNIVKKLNNNRNLKIRHKKIIDINKIKVNNNYEDIIFKKKSKTYNNFYKSEKKLETNEKLFKDNFLINLKANKLRAAYNDNYYNAKQFIDKTRKFLLIKYSSSIKNERKKRNEEIIDNKIEMIDDKIKSLKNVKSLYNQYFNYKLSEYVKFIFKKREYERKLDVSLLNQIYSLKKEISNLINKVKKIEIEKYSIIQWLFFQIRVKEKKLNLPSYYLKILEANIKRNNIQRRTAQADIRVINNPIKKNKSNIEKTKFLNKEQNNELTFSGVTQEEITRILKYKQNLIFDAPDDFLEEIKTIENKNIKLFTQIDILHSEIKKLKKKYSKILNDKLSFDNDVIDKIKEKEMELEENKKRYKINLKLIADYKNDRYNQKKNKNKKNNFELNEDYMDEIELPVNSKKLKLYKTVEDLFFTCQKIEIKKNKEIFALENQNFFIKKGNRTKEEEMLQMMEFIEVRICHLLNIFSIYKNPFNPNYEFIRKLRNNFMRKRKIEKAELARMEKEIKYMKLIKEVEDKNKKLLFLQRRKINMHNSTEWDNEQKKEKISKNNKVYIPTFEDFLFENINDEKYDLTIDNKNNENKNHFRAKS